jgi:nucleoside-diphosphate-sugar epimerase
LREPSAEPGEPPVVAGRAYETASSSPRTRSGEANVLSSDLGTISEGTDAINHLAWVIQPSRDAVTLVWINVEGSRRVFEAAAGAGVAKLVHASSAGACSRGPKDREVDEG